MIIKNGLLERIVTSDTRSQPTILALVSLPYPVANEELALNRVSIEFVHAACIIMCLYDSLG